MMTARIGTIRLFTTISTLLMKTRSVSVIGQIRATNFFADRAASNDSANAKAISPTW